MVSAGDAIAKRDAVPAAAVTATSDSAKVSESEVTKRAVEVFGDSGATSVKAGSDSAGREGPSWDIDVRSYETTARVEHYLRVFSGSAREHIVAQLQ